MPKPERMPTCGDVVIYSHGDPKEIGGKLEELPAIVVQVADDGRVAGQAFLPPGATVNTAQGAMPVSTMPIVAAYSETARAITWRWPAAKPAAKVVGLH